MITIMQLTTTMTMKIMGTLIVIMMMKMITCIMTAMKTTIMMMMMEVNWKFERLNATSLLRNLFLNDILLVQMASGQTGQAGEVVQ